VGLTVAEKGVREMTWKMGEGWSSRYGTWEADLTSTDKTSVGLTKIPFRTMEKPEIVNGKLNGRK